MRHFPIFLDLQGRDVLLLGGGEALEAKAALLEEAGARPRRAARFAPDLLEGIALACAAGAPEEDLRALHDACRARGIPVNVVDRPELCGFVTPAIVDRDPITIAIGTGGAAPVLARMARQRVETVLAPGLGRVAAMARHFRQAVRARLPGLAARRRFLDAALSGPAARLAEEGREAEAHAAFAAALERAEAAPAGSVHLVGAGPGAADLLTLRALRLLGEADVVVHDRLVPDEVLALARRDARRIYVGKVRAHHCVPQGEINALLVRLAREGLKVVRLKGGDPFIFGRGGEEKEAVEAAGIACEVVPGITAALACAAQAGIPLTHRDAARSLTLVTGHTRDGRLDVNFASLAQPGQTVAVYMGVTTLPLLFEGIVAAGGDPAQPAAFIERGGTPRQRVLRGSFAEVARRAGGWVEDGPALLLLGEACARGAPLAGATGGATGGAKGGGEQAARGG
ncbi:uroporphyrinogen-III C-methyltransferase [Pseudoroseomonas rhizosphaerae]|uniref:Uroporphyrinogen-III C-methyltransferase n=1 Tax=Teichococcus rhizosphaerae TaxID=1335062 RepID=A0A2C7AE22_9PROT|nr:siroheme synthase CysG [Pseudoroseomonas rhizosphaerae]PHK95324.1 uroporphyrinogen-III C-methyltransferase [Pseudoroseomonas rhizosphaerae]